MDTHKKLNDPLWENKAKLYTVPRGKSFRVIVNLPANCGLNAGEYFIRVYADTPVDTPPNNHLKFLMDFFLANKDKFTVSPELKPRFREIAKVLGV